MKKYSMFHVPFMSFYSKSLYRDVCFNWKGVAFGYLLLLVVVCWIPRLINIRSVFKAFVENDVPPMVSQIPTITITDGQASIDEPEPYMIVEPESGKVIFVIDTTGTIHSLDQAGAPVLLTETQVITRKNEYQTQVFELSEIGDMVIDQALINRWINFIKPLVMPVVTIFTVPFSYVSRIIQALVYGAIGLLFAEWCHSKRSYASLVRMSVLAVTPMLIVGTLLSLAKIHLPFSGLISLAVAMGYLYFGVSACASQEQEQFDDVPTADVLGDVPAMTPGPLIGDNQGPVNTNRETDIPHYFDESGR